MNYILIAHSGRMDMLKMIFGTSKPEPTAAENFTEFARTHNTRHAQKRSKGKKS